MRANILATATRLFSEQGYHETTVGQIADELDISSATFFNYFGSKEAIIRELAEEVVGEVEQLLVQLAMARRETVSLMKRHFSPHEDLFKSTRGISRDLSVEIYRVVLVSPESQAMLARMEKAIARVLTHSQELGEVRADVEPERTARAILHSLLGTVTAWLVDPTQPLEERLADTARFMRRSLAAGERKSPAAS